MGEQTVTVVGAGRLGGAVVRGYLKAGWPRERILIVQRAGATFDAWRARGFVVSTSFTAPTSAVLVVVKPSALPEVIIGLRRAPWSDIPVISLASGMTLAEWQAALGSRFAVLRARANVLVGTGLGNVLLAASRDPAVESTAMRVLEPLGVVHRVSESDMVAQTWFSSSLPIVGLARFLRAGLATEQDPARHALAERLVLQALHGLCEHLAETTHAAMTRGARLDLSAELGQLVDQVATPGGMNALAFETFDGQLSGLLESARSTYLSREPLGVPDDDDEEQP